MLSTNAAPRRSKAGVGARRVEASSRVSRAAPRRTGRRSSQGGWQAALERNLVAEGYSREEARELVKFAAS